MNPNTPEFFRRKIAEKEAPFRQINGQLIDPNQQTNFPIEQSNIAGLQNPFTNPSFQNQLPDIPIQEAGAAMLNSLLSDDMVPEDVIKEFWFAFHRDNTLTFLDEERKASKLLNFSIIRIDALNNTPWYEFTFDKEMKWNMVRQMFETKLDRALGINGKNERLTIPLTIQENITKVSDETQAPSQNFLKRMLSRK